VDSSNSGANDSPVYVIAGAYGGVGSAVAALLHRRGARLMLAGRNPDKLSQLAAGSDALIFEADASDFAKMKECVELAKTQFGRLDGVANCAGSLLLKPAHLTSEDEWMSVINANLTTAFVVARSAAKAMMGSGGSVVLVSSAAGRIGLANHEAIAAAKSGIEGLTRSAAATYGRHKVRVNCVAPGLVDTELTRSITSNPLSLKASIDMHALGRIGTAAEIARVIDWLLSSESSWVTGQTIGVDGGLSTVRGR
jgi:NAD(P)-dependent dehydrogenase (short-subunit alcohol dehydrogenase family)